MTEHEQRAQALFLQGYNCAQSVFCAFCDQTGLSEGEAARLASSFGGGMGRMREVCGAMSGAFLTLGALRGYDDPTAQEEKKAQYAAVQALAARFREKNGSILCRELLQGQMPGHDPTPEARTTEYYKKRPCKELVACAARLLDELLAAQEEAVRSCTTRTQPEKRNE